MLPPEGVLAAVARWLELLQLGTSIEHAWGLIRNAPGFADLSATQYVSALEWINELGLLAELPRGPERRAASADRLFATAISALNPPWLTDADALLEDPADLPIDALRMATLFGIAEIRILPVIQSIGRRADPDRDARIGLAGESALVSLLEETLPGSARHMSLTDDTLGYDIRVLAEREAHLEVKSTTRRGRLIVYLSRHEFEVGLADSAWALVVVGLDAEYRLAALATVRPHVLRQRSPKDVSKLGRWESVSLELRPEDLIRGLSLASPSLLQLDNHANEQANHFAWMPLDAVASPSPVPRSGSAKCCTPTDRPSAVCREGAFDRRQGV